MWDPQSAFGARVERRLDNEQVIWLVTVGKDGTPQPSPVWFLREDSTLLIYSKPDAPKVRNIERNPQVALHFNTDAHGGDVVVFTGTAAIDPDAVAIDDLPAYLIKYGEGIKGIGMTPEQMAQAYSRAIRVSIAKVRGF